MNCETTFYPVKTIKTYVCVAFLLCTWARARFHDLGRVHAFGTRGIGVSDDVLASRRPHDKKGDTACCVWGNKMCI